MKGGKKRWNKIFTLQKTEMIKDKVKLLIGVCKGKKLYDKRETIKERDIRRYESKMN